MKKLGILFLVISFLIIIFSNINTTNNKQEAVNTAISYLKITSFSKKALIEQLIHDGFSKSDSLYGVNNANANWYEQANKSAKTYLNIYSYEKEELIAQLEFDGFTHEEAIYGVKQNGL